jgi:hypothetical protein
MTHLIEVSQDEYKGFKLAWIVPDKTTYAIGDSLIVSMIGFRIQDEYIIEEILLRDRGYVVLKLSSTPDDLPSTVGGGFNDGEGEE